MGIIRPLPPHVVNQIAAGEVVERPASVVKELVENSIDAGARRIVVRLADGGRALVEVADDGIGMAAEDLGLAFDAHATSKLSDVEDLLHVASLGFRGEALASIGSVARAEVVTRARGEDQGWRVVDDHGVRGAVEPAAASPGTVVRVEGLFGRVPARRRFLRAASTELGHATEWVQRFAVAHPDLGFRLEQGPRTLLDVPPGDDRRTRIARVHGEDVARQLLAVRGEEGDLLVEGLVGPPSLHRGDGRLEQTFLNGRFVRDRTLAHAVRHAYHDLLPPGGRRPVVFLFVHCDPARVDVNVHPTKAEVRWRDASPVHRVVRRALRAVLEGVAPGVAVRMGDGLRPSTAAAVELAFTHPRGAGASVHRSPAAAARWTDGAGAAAVAEGPARGHAPAVPEVPAARGPGGLRPVGQLLGTYLVLEGEEEIVLVDQHALHERILFDRISARLREEGQLEVQRLLVPAVLELGPAETESLLEARGLLESLGWHVEPFGDGALAVHGLPAVLRRPDPETALREVLDALTAGESAGLDRARLLESVVDRMACRAAVMAGDRLHDEEVLALLEQAEALDHAHSCPHGRPTRLTLTRAELERWFHRTV